MTDPTEITHEFTELYKRYEHALKRSEFVRADRKEAQADWRAFANKLGNQFFSEVARRKIAPTLINMPPGKLMRDGLDWKRPEEALKNSVDLFVLGVCRVRNSLFHGEKFVGEPDQVGRDVALVTEALAVLEAAADEIPSVAKRLAYKSSFPAF